MTQHYTRNTISAEAWCGKCQKFTQHQVHDRRKGACLDCIAKLESTHAQRPDRAAAVQKGLFA